MKKPLILQLLLLFIISVVLAAPVSGQDFQNMEFTAANEEAAMTLRDGLHAMYDNDFSAAQAKLEKTLKLDPDNFMAKYMLSDVYGMMGEEEKSKALKDQAMAQTDGLNANEKVIQEMERQIIKGDMKTAAMVAGRLPKLNPDNFEALMWATYANMRAGESETGLEFAKEAAAIHGDIGALHNMMGYMYMDQGEMESAKSSFERYIELEPDHANPYDSMGDYYMASGDYAMAKKMFEKAYKMDKTMKMSKEKAQKAADKMSGKG